LRIMYLAFAAVIGVVGSLVLLSVLNEHSANAVGDGATDFAALAPQEDATARLGVSGSERLVSPATQVETRTMRLEPGFNFVGWTGKAGLVENLFAPVADNIDVVFSWDETRFATYRPNDPPFLSDLTAIGPGVGLWILSNADEAFEWEVEETVFSDIGRTSGFAGFGMPNLMAWTGFDNVAVEDAVAVFGDDFISVQTWDAAAGAFLSYARDLPAALNSLTTLNHGDAFWFRVDETTPWPQREVLPRME
jgi:hypothetical protein